MGMPGLARSHAVASGLDLYRRLEKARVTLARVADTRMRSARARRDRRVTHVAPPVERPRSLRRTAHLRHRARSEPADRLPQQRATRSAAWLLPSARIYRSACVARLSTC